MRYNEQINLKLYKYINDEFVLQAIIDDYNEISFNHNLFEAGEFTISINYNIPNALLFERGLFVQFGNDFYMFGEILNVTDSIGADGKGSQVRNITGKDARYLFKRRIIKNMNSEGSWVMTAKGEICMRSLIFDQCGAGAEEKRRLPITNIIPEAANAIGKEYSVSESFTNLYDILVTIATQSEIGWRLRFDGTLSLEVYNGSDLSANVQFSTDFDSLSNGTFTDTSESFANSIYVAGKGTGEDRDIYEGEIESAGNAPAGLNRFESFDNQSSMTTESEYEAEARSMLAQYGQTVTIAGNGLAKCPYIFKEQYNIGDIITIAFSGKSAKAQILSVSEHWAFGQYSITFSFGKPVNDLGRQLQLILNQIQKASNKTTTTSSVKYYTIPTDTQMPKSDVIYDTIGFIGECAAGGSTFQLYLDNEKTGAKTYHIYFKQLAGGKLTLTTGVSGATNLIMNSGTYVAIVYVDALGNVTMAGATATDIIAEGNNQPATSSGVAQAIASIPAVTIDSELSTTSTNPVQNKVITEALNEKQNTLTPGDNIQINDNVISATDTTYSDATQSAAGLMSAADKTKLDGIEAGAQVNKVIGVKGNSETTYRTGNVNITKSNIGLGSVANTGDSAVPVPGGTTKFTTGGAYIELNKKINNTEKGAANGVATLDGTGRVPYSQLPESAMEFKGTWDASTNTPELKDGTGTNGDFYLVSAGGTVNFGTTENPRNVTFYINDRVIYDGSTNEWSRIPASDVRSVNGMAGDVTITKSDVGLGNVNNTADANKNVLTSKRLLNTNITIQTGSTTQQKITLQTLMNWLITTKKYIPSGTACTVIIQTTWSYSGNDILRLAIAGTNYELQLAGVIIEFMGNATDYQTGMFRLRIHSSPTTSFTNTSGYTKFPVDHIAEYYCNGSSYSPVWKMIANKDDVPAAQVKSDWNATSGVAQILNKPSIPTKTSDLTNDSDFTTLSEISSEFGISAETYSGTSSYAINAQTAKANEVAASSSSASSSTKTVDITGFTLRKGSRFVLQLAQSNTATGPLYLNVGQTGAKQIKLNGELTSSTYHTMNSGYYNCYYDGTYWCLESDYEVGTSRNSLNSSNAQHAATANTALQIGDDQQGYYDVDGINSAISTAESNAKNLANATGTLPIEHGGTNATTAKGAEYNIIGAVETVETTFDDDRFIAVRNQTISASNGSFRWFKVSNLWEYIKSKISSVLGLDANNYAGNSATATKSNITSAIDQAVDCNTAAATAGKEVTLDGFTLFKGAKFIMNLKNANSSATALTLNVNGTGAKTIRINGTVSSTSTYTMAAGYWNCYYDGTYWCCDSGCESRSARYATSADYATQTEYSRGNAYCSTAAGTQAKVASMRGYVLATGGTFPITFAYANSYNGKITLNVNSKGAKDIWINGAVSSSTNKTLPAGTYLCTYDGSKYLIDTTYSVNSARTAGLANNSSYAEALGTSNDNYTKSSLDTALSGKVPTTRTVNGHALSSNVTVTASDVGLGNVDNTADANKSVLYAKTAGVANFPSILTYTSGNILTVPSTFQLFVGCSFYLYVDTSISASELLLNFSDGSSVLATEYLYPYDYSGSAMSEIPAGVYKCIFDPAGEVGIIAYYYGTSSSPDDLIDSHCSRYSISADNAITTQRIRTSDPGSGNYFDGDIWIG